MVAEAVGSSDVEKVAESLGDVDSEDDTSGVRLKVLLRDVVKDAVCDGSDV